MFERIQDIIQGKRRVGQKRSCRWPEVRAEFVALNPACAVCGGLKTIEVHHIEPFHQRPDLELNPVNLITLCEAKKGGLNCHLAIGHLGNYRSWNEMVRMDARRWLERLKSRP